MKKRFNTSLLMLACMAIVAVFTACEPENSEDQEKAIAFVCEGKTIADGSIYTSPTLGDGSIFLPNISIKGKMDGTVFVTVKSLNETMIAICGFGSCQMTLPYMEYTTTASGEISANTPFPLEIHYEPQANKPSAEALITAYYEGQEEDAVSFTLVMTDKR